MKVTFSWTLLSTILFLAATCAPAYSGSPVTMKQIGYITKTTKLNDGLLFDCDDHSQVRVKILAPDLVWVRASLGKPLDKSGDHSWAIDKTAWEAVPIKTFDAPPAPAESIIETPELRISVNKKTCNITFADVKTGEPISADSRTMQYNPADGTIAAAKSLSANEHIYGMGEKAAHLDKLHGTFEMWSSDTPGYTLGTDPIYQSIPFYIGLIAPQIAPQPAPQTSADAKPTSTEAKPTSTDIKTTSTDAQSFAPPTSTKAYGVFIDNSYHTHFDVAHSDPHTINFKSDGGEINYYFFYGPSMKKVVERYSQLTGRMPLPPKWALGAQQSRWSYGSEQEVKDIVSHYRRDNIPLDVIHLDIDYMNDYRIFTFDKKNFPDPSGLMKWLADQGVKAVTIIDPGVKYEPGGSYQVFNEGTERNYFLKQTNGQTFIGKVWPGLSVFVDYTLPDAAKWWGDLHKPLLDAGVSGIWNDMNEPADFLSRDGEKWKDVINYDEGQNSKHAKMRNLFAFLECKASYEGLTRLRPNERPFLITRSGYAGIQRYATMWTGDCNSTWDALAMSLPMFETLGLCGEPFVGADCGGFIGQTNGELLTRWYQVGFLSPFFRNHHTKDTYYQEPWRFGKQYEDIIRKYVQLRYRLLPHLYTVLAEAHENGLPWIRPLVLEYQNDSNVLALDDEFMVGDKILCAPVLAPGAVSREVYLPGSDSEWYDYFTHHKFKGGQRYKVEAPLDTVPLFVKAGSILPTGPVLNYVGEATDQKATYEIFPDEKGCARGQLYEDDGKSQAYLKGAVEHFTLKFDHGKLTASSDKNPTEVTQPDSVVTVCN